MLTCPRCEEPLYPLLCRRTDQGWQHTTCRKGWGIRRSARERAERLRAEARSKAEDVRYMTATGECASGAAARLGTTTDALAQWCKRHGLTPEWRRLNAREPRDWNRARGDAA